MTTQQVNRRARQRFALAPMLSPVSIQRVREGRMEWITGHAYDISESGMRIEVDGPVAPGDRMNISFSLPGHATDSQGSVTALCEAIWVNDADDDPVSPRAGVRFLRFLDASSAERMRACFGERWLRQAA